MGREGEERVELAGTTGGDCALRIDRGDRDGEKRSMQGKGRYLYDVRGGEVGRKEDEVKEAAWI